MNDSQRECIPERQHYSPPTKPIDKKCKIISQVTLATNPTLRLEHVGIRVNFWISRDGPDKVIVKTFAI
jgi:hypothetical protein